MNKNANASKNLSIEKQIDERLNCIKIKINTSLTELSLLQNECKFLESLMKNFEKKHVSDINQSTSFSDFLVSSNEPKVDSFPETIRHDNLSINNNENKKLSDVEQVTDEIPSTYKKPIPKYYSKSEFMRIMVQDLLEKHRTLKLKDIHHFIEESEYDFQSKNLYPLVQFAVKTDKELHRTKYGFYVLKKNLPQQ